MPRCHWSQQVKAVFCKKFLNIYFAVVAVFRPRTRAVRLDELNKPSAAQRTGLLKRFEQLALVRLIGRSLGGFCRHWNFRQRSRDGLLRSDAKRAAIAAHSIPISSRLPVFI